jgi:hypothetical protein
MMLISTGFDPSPPFSEDLKIPKMATRRVNDFNPFRATIEELVINGYGGSKRTARANSAD